MSNASRWSELIGQPFRASWRAGAAWAVVFFFFIVATVAFWPAFKGSVALNDALQNLPPAMLQAFGLQDFASPAGYLRGGLYDVLIPLMLAAAGAMFANSASAAQEDAGRIELFMAQPITRVAFLSSRTISTLLWVAVEVVVVLLSQLLSDALFGLDIGTNQIVSTVLLCGVIGLFCAALAIGIAGATPRPGLVIGIPLAVALVGYVISALFPLSDILSPWVGLSPWQWALGGDPLTNGGDAWRYAALVIPSLVFVGIGVSVFNARDIHVG